MKTIIFYIIFPFWYIFTKTYIGQFLFLIFCASIAGIIMYLLLLGLGVSELTLSNIGVGIGIFSLLCSPIIAGICMGIDYWMEDMLKK